LKIGKITLQNNITVLTACYNYGKYAERWAEGIISQTLKPDNVVVVNDGSTDNSEEEVTKVIEKYKGKHGIKWHLLNMKNSGPSLARNIGIKYSIDFTNFYAVYDMDDFYYPNKIKHSMAAMQDMDVGVVYTDYVSVNTKTGEKKREFKETFSFQRLLQECIVSNNSFVSKKALQTICEDYGWYDPELRVAEDYDLWLRLGTKWMIYHLPEALYEYAITGEGASFSVPNETWQRCWKRVHQKMTEKMQNG
jgi:glycosyltransferase involved in cell wall biosynthesis